MEELFHKGYSQFLFFSESFRVPYFINGPDKNGFHLGSAIKNVEEVFGTNRLLWFLPIYTRYDKV